MAILLFDPAKRRRRGEDAAGEKGRLLSLSNLSHQVIMRAVARHAQRELEQLQFYYKVTGGYPEMLPTQEQIQAFYEGDFEF